MTNQAEVTMTQLINHSDDTPLYAMQPLQRFSDRAPELCKPSTELSCCRDRQDPFTQDYTQLVQMLSNHHPAESRMVSAQPLFASPYFGNIS